MPAYALATATARTSAMATTGSTQNETNMCISNRIQSKSTITQFLGQMCILCVKIISIVLSSELFSLSLLSCSYLLFFRSSPLFLSLSILFSFIVERLIGNRCVWICGNGFSMICKCADIFSTYFGILMHSLMTTVVRDRVVYVIMYRKLTSNIYRVGIVVTIK